MFFVLRLTGGQEAVSSSLATRTKKKPCISTDSLFCKAFFFVILLLRLPQGYHNGFPYVALKRLLPLNSEAVF